MDPFTTRNFTIAIGDEDDFDVGPLSDTNPVPDKVPRMRCLAR